jgi:hypothetical protein
MAAQQPVTMTNDFFDFIILNQFVGFGVNKKNPATAKQPLRGGMLTDHRLPN